MIRRAQVDPSNTEQGTAEATDPEEDARLTAIRVEPVLGRGFVGALFGPLYEVLDSTVSALCIYTCVKV